MSLQNLDYPKDIEEAAIEWRLKINEGALTPEEELEFTSWRAADPRHEDAYAQAETVWAALGTLDKTKLRSSLFRDLAPNKSESFLSKLPISLLTSYRGWAVGGAAAMTAVLGFAIIGPQWRSDPVTIETSAVMTAYTSERGEIKTITLADQSKVTLGARTKLDVVMTDSERRIKLASGAAKFDVKSNPDRPFVVEAENFTATVMGTIFDVRSSAGIVRLSVAEGEVEVTHPFIVNDAPTSMMTKRRIFAGQKVTATPTDGLSQTEDLKLEDFATWREARLRYQGATLAELIADANRYSAREIILSDELQTFSEDRATMIFDGSDVERLLRSLPILFPVNIEDSGEGAIEITARPQ